MTSISKIYMLYAGWFVSNAKDSLSCDKANILWDDDLKKIIIIKELLSVVHSYLKIGWHHF